MSFTCKFCETQQSVVEKQTKADEDVANGKMPEGQYLKLCEITKKLYHNLLALCECKIIVKEYEDSDEEEEVYVVPVEVTINNTIELVGLPGDFIVTYLGEDVMVGEDIIDGNKRMVYPESNLGQTNHNSPFKHIYYDNNDNLFKQEIDWVVEHL